MKSCSHRTPGYTLVETLVAVSILLMGVTAAASLTLTMSTQEEINARVARNLHWHENAVRLYQLGLAPDEISEIMPPLPEMISHNISETPDSVGGGLTVPVATSTLIFSTHPSGDKSDASFQRQSELKAFRVTK